MTINQRLFFIMKQKNIRKIDLARGTGIKSNTISDWETKGTNPQADKISRICEFLGVSCDYLLTGKELIQNQFLEKDSEIIELYSKLDREDQAEVRGYIKGLLRTEKYSKNFYEETGKLA